MATSLKESKKRSGSRKCTQIPFIWWKDRENRSSRSWDNLSQVKKEEEITEGKIYKPGQQVCRHVLGLQLSLWLNVRWLYRLLYLYSLATTRPNNEHALSWSPILNKYRQVSLHPPHDDKCTGDTADNRPWHDQLQNHSAITIYSLSACHSCQRFALRRNIWLIISCKSTV